MVFCGFSFKAFLLGVVHVLCTWVIYFLLLNYTYLSLPIQKKKRALQSWYLHPWSYHCNSVKHDLAILFCPELVSVFIFHFYKRIKCIKSSEKDALKYTQCIQEVLSS